jgi:hypothetical protein
VDSNGFSMNGLNGSARKKKKKNQCVERFDRCVRLSRRGGVEGETPFDLHFRASVQADCPQGSFDFAVS